MFIFFKSYFDVYRSGIPSSKCHVSHLLHQMDLHLHVHIFQILFRCVQIRNSFF